MIPQTQSISLETKTSVTSFMDDLSVLSDYTHTELPKNNIIFCPECWEIPQLLTNSNNNKIISNCQENNHHKEYNTNEFCKKCIYHSLINISCNICQQTYSQEKMLPLSKSNSINSINSSDENQGNSMQFLYCEQCKDFFCVKCQKKHLKQKKNHSLILTTKLGVFCPFHNLSYTNYCFNCNKNICLKCVNKHISHKIVTFSKIKPPQQEINQKKMDINRARTELKKVEMVFKDSINHIYNKFNKLIEHKLEELNFKDNIIMTYEMRSNNFNSINNFKNLNANYQKFNHNLYSQNGMTDDYLDDSIGIDKIRNIYDYLQNKKIPILNTTQKNISAFENILNNTDLEEDFIFPKKSFKRETKKYTYINDNENNDDDIEKRYYELARSLDVREKKNKKDKHKLEKHRISNDNKINHYKINKGEDWNKQINIRNCRPINSNVNINARESNLNNSDSNNDNDEINNFPISKSWIKPNFKRNKNNPSQEEKNFKLGDKYLGKIKNNLEKFYTNQDNNNENNDKNIQVNRIINTEANKEENTGRKNNTISKRDLNTPTNIKRVEKNNPNFYTKKLNIRQQKMKFIINTEKKDPNSPISQPEIIKVIYDNKKEIMNLIILHDGNFCTSSWDSSVKVFNSDTYELLLKISEPNNNDVCYVSQLNDDSLILCSNSIFKYRLFNNDRECILETIISGYNDYIIKVIELKDNSIVSCDWEYKIKVWKKINNGNDNKNQYELVKSNINEGEHLSSLCRLNNIEFVSSSNSHLENGNDVLRFYDKNYNNYKSIYKISCSELVDTICQIDEQYLCIALQKWTSNQVKGLAIVDIIKKQIVRTIQGDSMTSISLINSADKIIITGGRDKANKKSIIRQWKLKSGGDLVQMFEVCTEQKDAITSIAKLKDGRIFSSNYDSTIVILK